jgi:hypothetical protein
MLTNNFSACDSASQLAAFIGLVPYRRQSGTSLNTYLSIGHVGHDDVRHHLYSATLSALRYNPVIKAYYDQVKARRKSHRLATIAAARKLIHLIWAIAQSDQPFDPDYMPSNIRNSPGAERKTMNRQTANHSLLYSFDAGNGTCKGLSGESRGVIQFEPVLAPLTDRRGLQRQDERPTFSLRVDDQALVFGVDDVFTHGKRTAIRRLNSQERYTHADYFRLLQVLFLQVFAAYRGRDVIAPTGVIAVPVAIYNHPETLDQMRSALVGQHELVDAGGCALRLDLRANRLLVIPESYGALMHAAYDPGSLKRRPDTDTAGTTLVVDIGYETTDLALFEGLKYQRDRAESILRSGMGIVTRALHDYLDKTTRGTDVSRLDRALRAIAGKAPGAPKAIEPSPGVLVDVAEPYDLEVDDLAARLAQDILTRYPEAVSRVLLAGGGAYHLQRALRAYLAPLPVGIAPDADIANVLGGFTALQLQHRRVAEV